MLRDNGEAEKAGTFHALIPEILALQAFPLSSLLKIPAIEPNRTLDPETRGPVQEPEKKVLLGNA